MYEKNLVSILTYDKLDRIILQIIDLSQIIWNVYMEML